MLNDFVPVIHRFPYTEHPNGMTIIPLADAHYGSPEFNEKRWHDTIKKIMDDHDCYCVMVGDMIDTNLKDSPGSVFRTTASPFEQKEWLYSEISPLAQGGKILAAVGGNHEKRIQRLADMDVTYDVLARLGIESVYRQNICFFQIKLTYNFQGQEKQRLEYSFAVTHGAGGGMYISSSANRLQNYGSAIEGIDCLIVGHTHRPLTFPVSKLVFDDEKVYQKQFEVVVASSFLDYGGYPVQKLLTPTAHKTTEILLDYSQKRKELHVKQ